MSFILCLLILVLFLLSRLFKPNKPQVISLKRNKLITNTLTKTEQVIPTATPSNLNTVCKTKPESLLTFQLMKKADCDQTAIEQILKITQAIPRPHPMLRELTKDIEDAEKLYQLVKSDPEIAAKILKTVNSSGFYLTQKITRLNHAINYLGTNMVKNIALQCVLNTNVTSTDQQFAQALRKIWDNAFMASSLTFIFAKHLRFDNASELATQSLLSYIGDLAIISFQIKYAQDRLQPTSLLEKVRLSQDELGANSALIGSELALKWELPQELVNRIHDSLIPLGMSVDQCTVPIHYLRTVVLCYFCCRMAELIIKHEYHDIAQVNILASESIDLFYLPDYLNATNLVSIFSLLNNQSFCREINKLLQKCDKSQLQKQP